MNRKERRRRKQKPKRIPDFASEAEEQEFWSTADTTKYFDWSRARRLVFPRLKPTTTLISMRLPETLLTDLKRLANEQDVPYQKLGRSLGILADPGGLNRPKKVCFRRGCGPRTRVVLR
jgi:predicted DNA binding CopG/RHH family protein